MLRRKSTRPIFNNPRFYQSTSLQLPFSARRFYRSQPHGGGSGNDQHQQQQQQQQSSLLYHNASVDVFAETIDARNVRVVCTLGPASSDVGTIRQLIRSGMSIARLNFSHSTAPHTQSLKIIENAREAAASFNQVHLGIAIDTKGPEIRLGKFGNEQQQQQHQQPESKSTTKKDIADEQQPQHHHPDRRHFTTGQEVLLTTDEAYRDSMSSDLLFVDYAALTEPDATGSTARRVLIADGVLELSVQERVQQHGSARGDFLRCTVTGGECTVGNRSNVHLPGVVVDLPAISQKDIDDLTFASKHGADFVFASFARSAAHVRSIRKVLTARGSNAAIIAKIENFEGIKNLEEIVETADGLMVARGDLGVDLAPERVFLAQKKIISICNLYGKPCICATQMLETMRTNPRPTRAEVSDVANAVTDGTDAVMLSAESASGRYPVRSTQTLSQISACAFGYIRHRKRLQDMISAVATPTAIQSNSAAAVLLAQQNNAKCILTLTLSGNSVRNLRMYSAECPIVAVCATAERARSLSIVRNVIALHFDKIPYEEFDLAMSTALNFLTVNNNSSIGEERGSIPENNAVAGCGLVLHKGDTVIISCTDARNEAEYSADMRNKSKTFETFVKIHKV